MIDRPPRRTAAQTAAVRRFASASACCACR